MAQATAILATCFLLVFFFFASSSFFPNGDDADDDVVDDDDEEAKDFADEDKAVLAVTIGLSAARRAAL